MSVRRSFVLRLLFALLLVFGQQQAIAHGLTHDFERIHSSSKDITGHDDSLCAKCLAIAHLDHATGNADVGVAPAVFVAPRCATAIRASVSLAFVGAYRSRAPPLFS